MHREIQIKQFPIVTTHWWPKTRNERFVWENEQYLYRFLPLVHNHVQVIWVHTHPVCDVCVWRVCVRALWLTLHSHGASASTLDGGRVWSVVLTRRHSYNNQSHTSLVLHERDWVFAWGDLIGWRLRWRLKSCVITTLQTRPPSARAHTRHTHNTHVTHWMGVRTQITGHGCVQEVKNDINTVRFSHTNRSFRVLGHQCVVTMGNCLIWISLCMFFFPLIENSDLYLPIIWLTRLEWFDLKTSKLIYWRKKTPTSGCSWVSW